MTKQLCEQLLSCRSSIVGQPAAVNKGPDERKAKQKGKSERITTNTAHVTIEAPWQNSV